MPGQPGGVRGGGEEEEMYRLQVPHLSPHWHGPGAGAGQGGSIVRSRNYNSPSFRGRERDNEKRIPMKVKKVMRLSLTALRPLKNAS